LNTLANADEPDIPSDASIEQGVDHAGLVVWEFSDDEGDAGAADEW
jgi:hypothetical protein